MSLIKQQIDSFLQRLPYNYFAIARFDAPFEQTVLSFPKNIPDIVNSNVISFDSFKGYRPVNFISSYPEGWLDFYFNHFYEIDPVLIRAKNTFLPFIWGNGVSSSNEYDIAEEQEELFDVANQYGISKGITVPIGNLNNMKAAITLSFEKNIEINNTRFFSIACHLAHLGNFVCYLQDKYDKKETLEQEELVKIYSFLSDSHHSCQATIS